MTGFVKTILLIAAVLLLETSVLPQYLQSPYKPDLLLIQMVFLALRAPAGASLPAAYGLGLLKDSVSSLYLGLNAFSFLLVALVLRLVSDRLYVQNNMLLVLTVSIATVAVNVVNLLLLLVFSEGTGLSAVLFGALIPHLLVNAFVASLVASWGEPQAGGVR